MKKILFFTHLLCITYGLNAQDVHFTDGSVIYIVRHAEKEKGDDPVLTEAGKKRSGDLVRRLKDKNIRRIYVTGYRRSGMTADSMRIQLGIDTVHYVADDTGKDLLMKIKSHQDSANAILVIGHSNTIPSIIAALNGQIFAKPEIPENEFDNLYIIEHIITSRGVIVNQGAEKYGARSGESATMKN